MTRSMQLTILSALLIAFFPCRPEILRSMGIRTVCINSGIAAEAEDVPMQPSMPHDPGEQTGEAGESDSGATGNAAEDPDDVEPVSDIDGDGVPDAQDKCPDSPSGYAVDEHGCADMARLFTRRVLNIAYPPGGSDLNVAAMNCLDSIADLLRDFRHVTVKVYGYTDNIGSAEANLRLSQKRADKVRDYLVRRGISENRIQTVGRGETDFVAPNSDKYGRERNRRIEIQFEY